MNRCFLFLKQRFNLFYCYLFRRHSINGGNVIVVETLFRFFDAARFSGAGGETTSVRESGEKGGPDETDAPLFACISNECQSDTPPPAAACGARSLKYSSAI
ncbi:hypothetical protein EHJ16_05370 [Cronobacter dublinensis]|nr:hypothetical protein [Cronobacter dublinensis]